MEEHLHGLHLQHHQYQHQHQQQQQVSETRTTVVVAEAGDRFPQWSIQETMEFLTIRAELDRTFMETKRNKLLWEVISSKLREKGFNRNAEQCKCKWKNLVTRYKACETMEQEATRQQFPFYNEMQSIFDARMHMMLWAETEGGPGPSNKTKHQAPIISSDEDDEEDSDGDKRPKKKPKNAKIISSSSSSRNNNNNVIISNTIIAMKEMLENFMKQQIEMEMQWKEAYEVREEERRRAETEWRFKMEELEKERLLMEIRSRENEEQRRIREEIRAEKRDALLNALLDKLRRE